MSSLQPNEDRFLEKRQDLERFTREQIIGPGAMNKRFFLLSEWESNEFKGKQLDRCHPILNISELIGEVPAYQYSSGIVFPIARQAPTEASPATEEVVAPDSPEDPEVPVYMGAEDEELQDNHLESTSSMNQSYPNTVGISIAMQADRSPAQDLSVRLQFRTYKRLLQRQLKEKKFGYWVQFHSQEVAAQIDRFYAGVFVNEFLDGNHFVRLAPEVNMDQLLYDLDYIHHDRLIREMVLPKVLEAFGEEGKKLFREVEKTYQGRSYTYTKLFYDQLNDLILKSVRQEGQDYSSVLRLIEALEASNQIKDLAGDLKSIFRTSSQRNKSMPIWQATSHTVNISLPPIDPAKAIQRGEFPLEGFDHLLLSYQYMLEKNGSLYVKLVLINTAVIQLGPNDPPQLNKKDKANELSLFGITIQVKERQKGVIVPYNPPNMLELDQEDSFNKLLYRQYLDFGEGYNTSVTWDLDLDEGLRSVTTEFLPEQETPDVDYQPSQVKDGHVVSRIKDGLLNIGELSTVSEINDEGVLAKLNDLVESYGKWIKEKRVELTLDSLTPKPRQLLESQLAACEADHARLSRNIGLLRANSMALAAFRLMNTAMLMQIHHSGQVKSRKKNPEAPVPEIRRNEGYYAQLVNQESYSWRSFQLAFVLLNIDAFVRPEPGDHTVPDVLSTGWPERNEVADLVWFPTGGGKTEAYLGIIAFCIIFRRFSAPRGSGGTCVLMRYTLRLLTLQQFQRASLMICALEVIRKDRFRIPEGLSLGGERITIGMFVGGSSLPNTWDQMKAELDKIAEQLRGAPAAKQLDTMMPHTECPWCGEALFKDNTLRNVAPKFNDSYNLNKRLDIMCNNSFCTFSGRPNPDRGAGVPICLFDEDIYKFPPTLLFGTVDKFAALANKASELPGNRTQDSRRLLGKGYQLENRPPELIIQDELHLLLGPLGSAVGLFEKAVDALCTYQEGDQKVRPKIVTSTATTRNTDKQIFALFERRAEIFPKQGIHCDDSFFAFYKRRPSQVHEFDSKRKYIGVLPSGKTQVWMQLRISAIILAHRTKFIRERFHTRQVIEQAEGYKAYEDVLDYYHTLLSYFNSLKEVGKTESQLNHYLPGDVNLVIRNTTPWTFVDHLLRDTESIHYTELTGRLTGEEVKSNLSAIQSKWRAGSEKAPPEFVIATNMISVGIDISRFNQMIINSMPRNTAEYIQASSRVARERLGLVFTVHHPFRSRDISHYQRFREFHEKFYSYVEPISITPFAEKALERYLAMYLAAMVRHDKIGLTDNRSAGRIDHGLAQQIQSHINDHFSQISKNARLIDAYLKGRSTGITTSIEGIVSDEELNATQSKVSELLVDRWLNRIDGQAPPLNLEYRSDDSRISLFRPRNNVVPRDSEHWNVKESLREIAPTVVIKTVQQ